jgi:hypothetical protein
MFLVCCLLKLILVNHCHKSISIYLIRKFWYIGKHKCLLSSSSVEVNCFAVVKDAIFLLKVQSC